MKKCLKCNKEYEDSDSFCPVCGEKLVSIGVCPHCGKPIDANDTFCRNCGKRIEKEFRCKKCNAIIPENSKFCPECGEKIVDPVVAVSSKNKFTDPEYRKVLLKKIFFFGFNAALLVLLLLMFIGCFGDIYYSAGTRSIGFENSTTSIDYFFGRAVKRIAQASENHVRDDYKNFMFFMLILEYLCWIGAIIAVLYGLIATSIYFVKNILKKKYTFKTQPSLISFVGALPYLFIFGLEYSGNLKGSVTYTSYSYYSTSTTTKSFYMKQFLGWGTNMILVCSLIGICVLGLYKTYKSIVNNDSPIKTSVSVFFKVLFYFFFVFSLFRIMDIKYSQDDLIIHGHETVYGIFTSDLQSYSFTPIDNLKPMSEGAIDCLIGILLLFAASIIGVFLYFSYFETSKFDWLHALILVVMIALFIVGYTVCKKGATDYYKSLYTNPDIQMEFPEGVFKYSPMGVVMPIMAVISMTGFAITSSMKDNKVQQ